MTKDPIPYIPLDPPPTVAVETIYAYVERIALPMPSHPTIAITLVI